MPCDAAHQATTLPCGLASPPDPPLPPLGPRHDKTVVVGLWALVVARSASRRLGFPVLGWALGLCAVMWEGHGPIGSFARPLVAVHFPDSVA